MHTEDHRRSGCRCKKVRPRGWGGARKIEGLFSFSFSPPHPHPHILKLCLLLPVGCALTVSGAQYLIPIAKKKKG